ncbi:MAG: hypothetical protein NTY65_02035 [Planctomycetota bacterium]|nr:hypothetical protein [Planctomycetota bacterium]
MSTKIGVIAEGAIDHVLLPPLLSHIAAERADFKWPLDTRDLAETFLLRKRGQGGVLEAVRRLVKALDTDHFDHACFVILLDHKTLAVHEQVRNLIRGKPRFVLGTAIEEIEAWWLGDRTNTLAWSGFTAALPQDARYAVRGYQAERDDNPKKTLDEITELSGCLEFRYGDGNLELAYDFAERFWRIGVRLDEIASQCPRGFGDFQRDMSNEFRRAKAAAGYLLR